MGSIRDNYQKLRLFVKQRHPSIFLFLNKNKVIYKYVSSGAVSSAIDLGLLFVLTEYLGVYYLISSCVAYISAFFVSFSMQKYWTFRDNTTHRVYKQAVMYMAIGFFNIFLNGAVMYVLVEYVGVWYMFSQVLVGAFIAVSNFLLYKLVIFKKEKIFKFINKK